MLLSKSNFLNGSCLGKVKKILYQKITLIKHKIHTSVQLSDFSNMLPNHLELKFWLLTFSEHQWNHNLFIHACMQKYFKKCLLYVFVFLTYMGMKHDKFPWVTMGHKEAARKEMNLSHT